MKLAVLVASCIIMWGGIALLFHFCNRPDKRAAGVAETALYASVDNPESVRIVAISEPDSVFGRNYVNDDEKMAPYRSEYWFILDRDARCVVNSFEIPLL